MNLRRILLGILLIVGIVVCCHAADAHVEQLITQAGSAEDEQVRYCQAPIVGQTFRTRKAFDTTNTARQRYCREGSDAWYRRKEYRVLAPPETLHDRFLQLLDTTINAFQV